MSSQEKDEYADIIAEVTMHIRAITPKRCKHDHHVTMVLPPLCPDDRDEVDAVQITVFVADIMAYRVFAAQIVALSREYYFAAQMRILVRSPSRLLLREMERRGSRWIEDRVIDQERYMEIGFTGELVNALPELPEASDEGVSVFWMTHEGG